MKEKDERCDPVPAPSGLSGLALPFHGYNIGAFQIALCKVKTLSDTPGQFILADLPESE